MEVERQGKGKGYPYPFEQAKKPPVLPPKTILTKNYPRVRDKKGKYFFKKLIKEKLDKRVDKN